MFKKIAEKVSKTNNFKQKAQEEQLQLILRDVLAVDRTRLANQRTVLSFFRTGLSLVVTALAIFEFKEDNLWYIRAAWAMVGLGVLVIVAGFISYFVTKKRIKKSYRAEGSQNKPTPQVQSEHSE